MSCFLSAYCILLAPLFFANHSAAIIAIMPGSSDVWNFFTGTGRINKTTDLCECNLCKKEFKQSKGCTTNLRNHLLNHHRKEYADYKVQFHGSSSSTSTSSDSKVQVSAKTKRKLAAFISPNADNDSLSVSTSESNTPGKK